METGFFGKCFIAIVAGFVAASLYHFIWVKVIVGADKSLNQGYQQRTMPE